MPQQAKQPGVKSKFSSPCQIDPSVYTVRQHLDGPFSEWSKQLYDDLLELQQRDQDSLAQQLPKSFHIDITGERLQRPTRSANAFCTQVVFHWREKNGVKTSQNRTQRSNQELPNNGAPNASASTQTSTSVSTHRQQTYQIAGSYPAEALWNWILEAASILAAGKPPREVPPLP